MLWLTLYISLPQYLFFKCVFKCVIDWKQSQNWKLRFFTDWWELLFWSSPNHKNAQPWQKCPVSSAINWHPLATNTHWAGTPETMATTPEILNVLYYSFKIDSADKEHSLTFLICVLHSIDIANCEFKIFWGKKCFFDEKYTGIFLVIT